ncbi:YqhG family protein [Brevibacillus massiliensis]|uniref:YqhG family protein n=1 Tax=Brevibacillus massiliensis TaxID=1118054 RepID=UPI0002DED5A5|nr:YqhG family protein [Brevibacillus massiliensis]
MEQQQMRRFIETYLAAFSAHICESHPDYLTVKLPEAVDKDIGNRPFYWSWIEKMNMPPQPMILTFAFDPDRMPEGVRAELLHLGAGRLQQIFRSAQKHGRFVCMYELAPPVRQSSAKRRSLPLVPWLGVNVKISFICDKKKDLLLYLGVNLHQPKVVFDFYPSVRKLALSPSIPDYFYTLDQRLTLEQAAEWIKQAVDETIEREDHRWAEFARERLAQELDILEAYYTQLTDSEGSSEETASESSSQKTDGPAEDHPGVPGVEEAREELPPPPSPPAKEPVSWEQHQSTGGRILDFLRINGIPVTPKEQIEQTEWRKSTPQEERERRIAELKWQYEPRIEVTLINAGLFYLHSAPSFAAEPQNM